MDNNQSPYPVRSTPSLSPGGGSSPIMFILIGVLGLGTIVFGILAVVSYSQATNATKNLETKKTEAAEAAKTEQKKADDLAYTKLSESPYRSYAAPTEYGSFEIKFPKNWSSTIDHERSGTQVNLVVNPDFVRRTNGTDELAAARITLREKTKDQFLESYSDRIKRGTIKQTDITVSGLRAYNLTGQFSDQRTNRIVVVPIRDKVLVFINENDKYAQQFNEILAQSKIVP